LDSKEKVMKIHQIMRSCVSMFLLLLTVAPGIAAAASDACNAMPPLIVSTSPNPDPALIAKEAALLQSYMSDELIKMLKDAAADSVTWDRASRDPAAFLTEKGFPLPDGVSVRFFSADQMASGPRVVWDTGCPAGLVPITTTTIVKVCDRVAYIWRCHQDSSGGQSCMLEAFCAGTETFKTETTTFCGLDLVVDSH
jgi:hypothetical protein